MYVWYLRACPDAVLCHHGQHPGLHPVRIDMPQASPTTLHGGFAAVGDKRPPSPCTGAAVDPNIAQPSATDVTQSTQHWSAVCHALSPPRCCAAPSGGRKCGVGVPWAVDPASSPVSDTQPWTTPQGPAPPGECVGGGGRTPAGARTLSSLTEPWSRPLDTSSLGGVRPQAPAPPCQHTLPRLS